MTRTKSKTVITLVIKIIALTFALLIIQAIASKVAGMDTSLQQQVDPAVAGQYALLTSFLFTGVLSYPIMRSTWSGWKLVLTIAVVFYGVMTFLSQIETVVFLRYLVDIVDPEMIPKLFVEGAVVAALFSPIAVWAHGKMKRSEDISLQKPDNRLVMTTSQWAWKLTLCHYLCPHLHLFGQLSLFLWQETPSKNSMSVWRCLSGSSWFRQ